MSSTTRYKDGYREHVYVNGHRESKTFRTKREAKAWGAKREAELSQRAKAGRPTPGVLRGRCSLGAAHAGPSAMSTRALTLKSKGPWSRLSVWHHVPIKRVKAKAKGLCIVSRGATLDKPVFSHSLYKNKCFLRVSTDARHLMGAYSRARQRGHAPTSCLCLSWHTA